VVPARVARLAPDVLEAVLHHPPPAELGPAPRPAARCLAEQAKILFAEAQENNLDYKARNERWDRWHKCSLCEQHYHSVVRGALGWACWKTYVGRPEADLVRYLSLEQLANGLTDADHHEDALSVREAELSMRLRLGDSQENVLIAQGNLAATYVALGRLEEALRMLRDVYSGRLKLSGEEHSETVRAAYNSANALMRLRRFKKPRCCCAKKRSPWRDAFSVRVMSSCS